MKQYQTFKNITYGNEVVEFITVDTEAEIREGDLIYSDSAMGRGIIKSSATMKENSVWHKIIYSSTNLPNVKPYDYLPEISIIREAKKIYYELYPNGTDLGCDLFLKGYIARIKKNFYSEGQVLSLLVDLSIEHLSANENNKVWQYSGGIKKWLEDNRPPLQPDWQWLPIYEEKRQVNIDMNGNNESKLKIKLDGNGNELWHWVNINKK